jgi:nicotinate-nucleotide pyrophosphorylase
LDEKSYEMEEIKINEKGFITLGSADNNDIKIEDCLFLNKNHIKLSSTSRLVKKPKKRNYF